MDETNYYFSFLLITIKERLQRRDAKMFPFADLRLNETGAKARQGLDSKLFASTVNCTQFEE